MPATMFRSTCEASAPKLVSCTETSACRMRRATRAATPSSPAPTTTTSQAGSAAAAPSANPIPTTWNNAPPACDRPLPWSRSLPESTSGIAADFTASATRTHACATSRPITSPSVATTSPSVGRLAQREHRDHGHHHDDRGHDRRSVHSTTLRRSKRSMNTPMNGEISV